MVTYCRIEDISQDSNGRWSCVVQTAQGNDTKSINIVVNEPGMHDLSEIHTHSR